MQEKNVNIRDIRDWGEPAHPAIIERYDDLLVIYTHIRDKYQKDIDKSFDTVSRQIGFVVTTTVPVVLEVGDRGKVKSIDIAENLKGTLFEKISSVLSTQDPVPAKVKPGKYNLYLVWSEALKIKLRTEWMEPAHFRRLAGRLRPAVTEAMVKPDVREPAHWFDPGIAIAGEDAIQISVLDDVYPDLKLANRVASAREAYRVGPGVREPAHFRQIESGLLSELASVLNKYRPVVPDVKEPAHYSQIESGLLPELISVINQYGKVGPGVREPAHFRQIESGLLSDLASILRRYGY